ncbi:MAG: hypothetical protein ACLQG3_00330 [Terracidiphilus sp.]
MTRESTTHLSNDALNDVLIGLGDAESEFHLAACPLCRAKVEEFRSGLDTFNQTTQAWSEARSSTSPRIEVRPRRLRLSVPALSWALAAAVLLTVAAPVWRHNDFFPAHRDTQATGAPEDSEAQIAEDNELLKEVDAAINPEEVSPIKEYDLSVRPHPRHRQRPQ